MSHVFSNEDLKNRRTGQRLVNQNVSASHGDIEKQIIDGGMKWMYSRRRGKEQLHSAGPVATEYAVLVCFETVILGLFA